jgi:hypothetical protein
MFLLLLQIVQALEATIEVEPNIVGVRSDLHLHVMFDQSLGWGGVIQLTIPEEGEVETEMSHGLLFNNELTEFVCEQLDSEHGDMSHSMNHEEETVERCEVLNGKTLEITMKSDVFVLAGSSLELRIVEVTTNPTSLWYADKSLILTTLTENR